MCAYRKFVKHDMAIQEKKQIVLVDDHVIIRNGLRGLIERLGPYEVCAEFDSGRDLLDSLPFKKAPDLVIMDLSMPGMNGDEVMEQLNSRQVKIPVMILTLDEDDAKAVKLFRLGIRGYLRKNCTAPAMKAALEELFGRGFYHNEFLTYSLQTHTTAGKKTEQQQILDQLTEREREFLKLVCHEKEYTYTQIADIMSVQPRTVDGYRESIFEKFDIKSKTGLVLFVLRYKLFDHL